MIVEQRTYDIVPGKIAQYVDLYERLGVAVQVRHLGALIGYFHSEFGDLNQITHLWRYDDLSDRATRRARLFADPDWLEFFHSVLPIIVKQRSVLLNPLTFVSPQPALISVGG